MSFAIAENNPLLYEAVKKATNAGIIVVASASNTYGGTAGYPASYDNVISVTAVDKNLRICESAPRGKIDVSAPGVDIVSTSYNGDYEKFLGTSLAAPNISGIVALILQKPENFGLLSDQVCTFRDVYNILKEFTIDLGKKGKDEVFGEGFCIFGTLISK